MRMVCGPVHIIKHYRIKGMPKMDTFVAVPFHPTCINVRLIFTIRYFHKSIYFRNISIIVSASETRSHRPLRFNNSIVDFQPLCLR